jgi:ATP-dependent Zn protease
LGERKSTFKKRKAVHAAEKMHQLAVTAVHEAAHAVAYVVLFGSVKEVSVRPKILLDGVETELAAHEYQMIVACKSDDQLSNLLQSGKIKSLNGHNGKNVRVLSGGTVSRRANEYDFPNDMERLAVCQFAGPAAEEMYTHAEISLTDPAGSASSDINNFLAISGTYAHLTSQETADLFSRAFPSAHKFVWEHRVAIQKVAEALLVKNTLTGDEVKAIADTTSLESRRVELVAAK